MKGASIEDASGIAIIGLAGRFPGARNVAEFWERLRDGVECITFFSDEELAAAGVPAEVYNAPNYVKANGVLEDIELFDAPFFGFSPREAEIMDPQHRLFLEASWEALEDAGYNSETYPGQIGIYGGMHMSKYLLNNLLRNREAAEAAGALQLRIWNDKDFLCSLAAYKLNLRGPSVTVQTACSTSLVAVCLACQSLQNYQCDVALAGGVTVGVPHRVGGVVQEGVLSPDGHCRAFDARAQGTVNGNGLGVVVLKRLADALADGDHVYAVIKGTALNNDGSAKVGYTAPGVEGQAEVIGMAQALADVSPETITYVETHGTGTPLGDPVEVAALTEVFRAGTDKKGFCALGSVKTNIGHLDAAAGVASLIKTVKALEHKQLPPSLNFESPNPAIDFAAGPFYVNDRLAEWPANGAPRRAGVSSFAMGGVNAHVILEEAPEVEPSSESRPWQVLVWSAWTNSALERMTANLLAHLKQHPEEPLADVAYTLQVGRRAFNHRRVLVCRDAADAVRALENAGEGRVLGGAQETRERPVVFAFPGQGAQYVGMAAELYRHEPTFREQLDLCAELLAPRLKTDLREVLFPADSRAAEAAELLDQTWLTQPALFAVEYALARQWMEWGVRPAAMIGHSIGEYVAACLAGVFSLDDALALVAERGRLMQQLPGGSMLAVGLPEERVRALLKKGLSLAAVNGDSMCVVAGFSEMVAVLQRHLAAEGVECRLLRTSHAFHSEMVEPILPAFLAAVRRVKLSAPEIPYISNVTGMPVTAAEATDPTYWAKHLRQTVRFADGLTEVLADKRAVLVEVGPGRGLGTLIKRHPQKADTHVVLSSLPHMQDKQSDLAFLLTNLGRLWLAGQPLEWTGLYGRERRRRVRLPTYPFERQRYWIEPQGRPEEEEARRQAARKSERPRDWLHAPLWKQSVATAPEEADGGRRNWIVLLDEYGFGRRLAGHLRSRGQAVTVVRPGERFAREGDEYVLDPGREQDYESLFAALGDAGHDARLLHLWTLTGEGEGATGAEAFRLSQERGTFGLLALAQALGRRSLEHRAQIVVLSNHLLQVGEDDRLLPHKATLLGLSRSISQEYPQVNCRCVDVPFPAGSARQAEKLLDQLTVELAAEDVAAPVAYRGGRRWLQTFERVPSADPGAPVASAGGVDAYLFAGWLDDRAAELARSLAGEGRAAVLCAALPGLPAREDWTHWLLTHDDAGRDQTSLLIERLQGLEAAGVRVAALASAADEWAAPDAAVARALGGGALRGIVYTLGPAEEPARAVVQELSRDGCGNYLQARLAELSAVRELARRHGADFCLLQASAAPLVGGAGLAAYSAAAHLLDAFAAARRDEEEATRWVSVKWDEREAFGAPSGETAEVYRRVLAQDLGQLVISPFDFEASLAAGAAAAAAEGQAAPEAAGSFHSRPELAVAFVPPRSEEEQRLTDVWRQLLGFAQVGVHDDFFELGGHSLLATQLVSRVRDAFNVVLPLETLFAAPTVAGMAEAIGALSREEPASAAVPIKPVARDGKLPLSFSQQRMWLFDQLEPQSAAYNIAAPLRLGGPLDAEVLERCFHEVVRRHEILRTSFRLADGAPVQEIAAEMPASVTRFELDSLPEAEREARLRQLMIEEVRRPFDLSAGPLMRVCLYRLGEAEHVLLTTFHHIAADGWSLGVLYQELQVLYAAYSAGEASPLAELPFQYADFAVWQREQMQGETYERQLAYWREQLADPPGALDLPTDRPRPSAPTYRGATKTFELAGATLDALQRLTQHEGATTFMALLAVYQTLLYRYTGQEDIAVGTPIANRGRSELEGLIGFFANTLVMRTKLSGGLTFRELLDRVREVALGAYTHQDVPFEQVGENVRAERDAGHAPLFQTMLVLQNMPRLFTVSPEQGAASIEVDRGAAMFDLTLYLRAEGDGLAGLAEYNTDLFEEATVGRLVGHFAQLIESAAADPDARLDGLELLTPREREQLLGAWNATAAEYPRRRCLHELFEEQAGRTPAAVAVAFGEEALTYAELEARANQLARHLRRLGVGPESRVGVCLERSAGMVVALLGVLKAGGAYVPLDPAYPRERLSFILEDVRADVLLTQQSLAAEATGGGARQVLLDADWAAIAGEDQSPPAPSASGENLAYVIYTSGSTGRPKGVQIPHRAVVNFLLSMARRPGLTAGDVLLAVTTLSFDIAGLELFLPLTVGARVCIAGREEAADAELLAERLRASGATVMQATPATWHLLLASGWQGDKGLKVLCGGEAFPPELARQLAARCASVWNMYGPTETTVWSSVCEAGAAGEPVAVGPPIANTTFYVLDRGLRPVPVGVAGELHIGGDGLARGYYNRPSLTAERFVPDPFGSGPGSRLYKTGDLMRYLPDGRLEFLGRLDHQVKIRGHRVELGEIEAALRQHPGVEEAVVLAREEGEWGHRLVGYVATRGAEPGAGELRRALRERLPEYMVPGAFVALPALPLTPNGKVDRKALLAMNVEGAEPPASDSAPGTPTKELVVNLWSKVLGRKRVGAGDDFFDLGGHSLLAIQLLARVVEVFQVRLSLRSLFEARTPAAQAEVIEAARAAPQQMQLPPLAPAARGGALPLSFGQQRLWFLSQLRPDDYSHNIFAPVRIKGGLDVGALEKALNEVVRRHEALRTYFTAEAGQPAQLVVPPFALELPVTDLQHLPESRREAEVRRLAVAESQQPFDLSRVPLLRARLLKLGADEHVLLLTIHHIVSDAWSMRVLVGELAPLYEAFREGRPSPLAELRIQYPDVAVWQRQWLDGEALEGPLNYWKQQLAALPPRLELAGSRPRPLTPSGRGSVRRVELSDETFGALKALGRQEASTLFMTMLAAFQILLHHYSRQEDLVVGTDATNRGRVETEELIGFFVNQLVLRTNLSGDPTFRELLGRVRAVSLDAYAHQDVPFEKVVEAVKPERSLSHAPLFQVKITHQQAAAETRELAGVTLSPLELHNETAQLDLILMLVETPQQLDVYFNYSTEVFDEAAVARLARSFETLLGVVAGRPEAKMSEIEKTLGETSRGEQEAAAKQLLAFGLNRLKSIKPKPTDVRPAELVKTGPLAPGGHLPLLVEGDADSVDLGEWVADHRAFVEASLLKHGAILFRGFRLSSAAEFERFARAVCSELFAENGEHPRQNIGGQVYTPVFYPPESHLLWHNENSFNHSWPTKILFGCVQPAAQGGETPIVDSRQVYDLLDPSLRAEFAARQVMYVRNYGDSLGLDWREVFRTDDKAEVERRCRLSRLGFEWKAGDRLKTFCVRPAVVRHPRTGEAVWFNQAQHWHVSCLDPATRASVLSLYAEDDLPRSCRYGDGSPIPDAAMDGILSVYRRLEVVFPWRKDDILLLDNLLTAHARNRFSGTRKLLVAMGEMLSYADV